MAAIRRKGFNFICTATAVTVQKLGYADMDSPAHIEQETSFQVSDLPAEFTQGEGLISLAAYGLSQLLQDRTSSVDSGDKLEKMAEIFETLKDGKWRETRESTAQPRKAAVDVYFASGFSMFLQSVGKNVDVGAATAILQDMTPEQRKALKADERVAPFIKQAQEAARAAAEGFDLNALLG